ncbi:tetraacyldisaccharide 4'-kinase [Vitreoscilla stercoraria]|uniref:Tetraacyldisaccharide 4'-kinase n=1 Tax=Vitreoscilla stercoraria TaxID=61 RepID=A0ABY4E8W9_VITST|nr:tetraacyldisaccharide 4'-kinase [Vitreoscilla stercoraria]UOO91365.1 tetraacyldisaccharide 4'-kinase [Vitreoscilla stercoraria]
MSYLIEEHWQQPKWYLTPVLKPLSCVFARIAQQRHQNFLQHPVMKWPVPIVVVGNIHVGGVGKTPMVIALTQALQEQGLKVGLVSRGYGRKSSEACWVNQDSHAADVGDEPLLLVKKTQAPMVVASKRVEAVALLLSQAQVDVIVADDGLQHYALSRDLELVVFPSEDVGRVLDVLPNGPLREALPRLQSVNAVIVSRTQDWQDAKALQQQLGLSANVALFQAKVTEGELYAWNTQEAWQGKRLLAVCGIGRPEQFEQSLQKVGVKVDALKRLPDHGLLDWNTLPEGIDGIVTTEKDAIKWQGELPLPVWVLPINATIMPNLATWVMDQLALSPTQII